MVTETDALAVHEVDVLVTVTVYTVVPGTDTVTVGLETVALLNPVEGDQLYERPATGAAPSWALPGPHKVTVLPALAAGKVFMVTDTDALAVHEVEVLVTVTV